MYILQICKRKIDKKFLLFPNHLFQVGWIVYKNSTMRTIHPLWCVVTFCGDEYKTTLQTCTFYTTKKKAIYIYEDRKSFGGLKDLKSWNAFFVSFKHKNSKTPQENLGKWYIIQTGLLLLWWNFLIFEAHWRNYLFFRFGGKKPRSIGNYFCQY